jgi:DNA-binding Lrp family transcriptional regulator
LDELDVKIFRSLISQSVIAPSNTQVTSSLREIARKLSSDDMTVWKRFKKLQDAGCMSVWKLVVNPTMFGYMTTDLRVEVQPESAKADMIRKLRLVPGVIRIAEFLGPGLQILLLHNSEESRSRAIELISRITNTEKMTQLRQTLPMSLTKRLTETDMAIIRALAMDARRPYVAVAKELGLSSRTVKSRIDKLRSEKTLFAVPELKVGDIPGLIPVVISYSYAAGDVKDLVDRAMISHFDASFLWGLFSVPDQAYVVLGLSSMVEAQRTLNWAMEQPGVAKAQLDILVGCTSFPEKLGDLVTSRVPDILPQQ